jgi:hypothetical protein
MRQGSWAQSRIWEVFFLKRTRKAIYRHLKPFQKTAIKNAEFLELKREDYSVNYPRAEVFKLIEQLIPPQ